MPGSSLEKSGCCQYQKVSDAVSTKRFRMLSVVLRNFGCCQSKVSGCLSAVLRFPDAVSTKVPDAVSTKVPDAVSSLEKFRMLSVPKVPDACQ